MSFSEALIGSESNRIKPKPFLKWAGGKTQLLPELLKRLPKKIARYYEPFIGGGALFFNLAPANAYISDINQELINCYLCVRDGPEELIEEIQEFSNKEDFFYQLRNADRSSEYKNWKASKKAARLIFLNRTCFNGLYRVNSKGQFNVPFGDYKNPCLFDFKNLMACSTALSKTEIVCTSFLTLEDNVRAGDFVYFDPPYAPLSKTSNFTAYTKSPFGEKEQLKLKELCTRLDQRGVSWMLSNSSSELVENLFASFNIDRIKARRNINSKGSGRGVIDELIVTNY